MLTWFILPCLCGLGYSDVWLMCKVSKQHLFQGIHQNMSLQVQESQDQQAYQETILKTLTSGGSISGGRSLVGERVVQSIGWGRGSRGRRVCGNSSDLTVIGEAGALGGHVSWFPASKTSSNTVEVFLFLRCKLSVLSGSFHLQGCSATGGSGGLVWP